MRDEVLIIPAILANTEDEYRDKLKKIESSEALAGGFVQIDLIDNKFAKNKTVGVDVVGRYQTNLKLEAQLMVEYPENWIDGLVKIEQIKRIVIPVEDREGIKERVRHIKDHMIEVGVSVNPETDINEVEDLVSLIDLILVMSVHPGFGGQEFIPASLEKIKAIKAKGWPVQIEVDGGVNEDVIGDLIEAGADNLVVGSHLLEGDIDENLERIWEASFK